jgi:hypothetical protein
MTGLNSIVERILLVAAKQSKCFFYCETFCNRSSASLILRFKFSLCLFDLLTERGVFSNCYKNFSSFISSTSLKNNLSLASSMHGTTEIDCFLYYYYWLFFVLTYPNCFRNFSRFSNNSDNIFLFSPCPVFSVCSDLDFIASLAV